MSESYEEVLDGYRDLLRGRESMLMEMLVAVGRVGVFEGVPTSRIDDLPQLVALLATDHDELEKRITAVVDYIRSLPDDQRFSEPVQKIGRIIQGTDLEIIDLT